VLEEELEAVRHEVTDLQRRLGEVEDQREALEEGALAVFRVVEPREPMHMDQLQALPKIIRSSVRLGIRRGATAALAVIHLHTGTHLGGIDPGFPETSSASSRRLATRLLAPQFMDQGLAVRPAEECTDDIGVDDARQQVALLGATPDVVVQGLTELLLAALEVPRVARAHVRALKVADEDLAEVCPTADGVSGQEV
jgi:hypothetical protein